MARAALSETPATYAKEQPGTHTISFVPCGILTDVRTATLPSQAVDASLPNVELIADSVKRFIARPCVHFYSPLCEIASVPRTAPSACILCEPPGRIIWRSCGEREEGNGNCGNRSDHASGSRRAQVLVSFDARELVRKRLKEVGRELGVPR
jgi:hypothetical protein